ncbi:MAG: Fe-S protein assembly co-chaperone HscB [Chitinophagaceae bacterium]
MDYFALFSLPVSLRVDTSKVLMTYYKLCQQYHPDRMGAGMEDEALRMSTEINRAKKMLDQPLLRLEYILQQQGLLPEDEKFQLPPLFLSDMMDINEALMDARLEGDNEKLATLENEIQALDAKMLAPVAHYFNQEELQADDKAWQQLKLYYYQHKYLMRLVSPNHDM